MVLISIISGLLFGLVMQYAHVNKFNTISGMATLEDYTMAKVMGFAIGLGAILISIEVGLGWADYGIKPLRIGGNVVGGLVFGTGMAILGYCPGTLPISLGQGALDALVGIIGGLLGGLAYTLLHPVIAPMLGPDLGKISMDSLTQGPSVLFYLLTFLFGSLLMFLAFVFHRKEGKKDLRWLVTGISLALLNAVLIHKMVQGSTIGASSTYPWVAGMLTGVTEGEYFGNLCGSGRRQVVFLGGAILGGLIPALIRRDFKFQVVYSRWAKYHGPGAGKRLIYAFLGGFLLIFGARIGGGCASGHILSGIMKMSVGSLLFALTTFAAFFATGQLFYKRRLK